MKWKVKQPPKIGDTRTIRRFLWLPRRIGDEYRWLEWAEIRQGYFGPSVGWGDRAWGNGAFWSSHKAGVVKVLSCKCGWAGTDPEYVAGQGVCPDCGNPFATVYSQDFLDGYRAWHNGLARPDGEGAACGWEAAGDDYE